jgi:hypothetical protein
MQSTAARGILVSLGILGLTGLGCKQTKSCAPNTAFIALTFSGAALNADALTVVTCLADACRPAEFGSTHVRQGDGVGRTDVHHLHAGNRVEGDRDAHAGSRGPDAAPFQVGDAGRRVHVTVHERGRRNQ